jgi:spermidine synthase
VGALFFVVGFVALGSQVLLTRFLALLVHHSVYTYALTLTTSLLGIVGGSVLAGGLADRIRSRALLFGSLQIGFALLLGAVLRLPPSWWAPIAATSPAAVAALLLPPALLSGASFPVAIRLVVRDPSHSASVVGRLTALNTLGGILGSLVVGLVLLPLAGLETSLRILTATSLLAGAAAWLAARPVRRGRAVAVASALALWLLLPPLLRTRVPADHLAPPGELVAVAEGRVANVAVVQKPDRLQLELDRFWQGQDVRNHQAVAAHVPMLLHPEPRTVLVVGIGAGQTASRFLLYDGLERLDCVDLEPAVFEVVARYFDGAWMRDPRVRLLPRDGRVHLAHARERYDVISLELGQLFRPGVAAAYTRDFYARAAERLRPGGLLVQFVPLPFFEPESLRRAVASLLAVLPESVLWYNGAELLLVGRRAAGFAIDPTRLALLDADGPVQNDLVDYWHWGGPTRSLARQEVFLAGFLLGPPELRAFAGDVAPYAADPPELEYAVAPPDPRSTHELATVAALRRQLAPVERLGVALPPEARTRVRAIRDANLAEIEASALVRRADALRTAGDLDAIEALVREALHRLPEHGVALRMEGDLLTLRGRPSEALAAFERALVALPRDPALRRGLGFVLQQLDRPAEAAVHYRAALAIDPDDPETHNHLGVALARRGHRDAARRHFAEALRLDPGYEDAARNLRRIEAASRGG